MRLKNKCVETSTSTTKCLKMDGLLLKEFVEWKNVILENYKFSTSFSFSLKMFLSSPNVDSIFSRENCCSPSAPLSFATHELSSVTVLSRSCHSLTRVSHFFIHSSATALTLAYLSLSAATSTSASLCVVILFAAAAASSRTLKCLWHEPSKVLTVANMALASSNVCGFARPSCDLPSA